MAKDTVLVNIDDITKKGIEIKLKEGADVFKREGEGFKKVGTVGGRGFTSTSKSSKKRPTSTPTQTPTPEPTPTSTPTQTQSPAQIKAGQQLRSLQAEERELRSSGARETLRKTTDVKTGERVNVTTIRKGPTTITKVDRPDSGTQKITRQGIAKGGGTPRTSGGVTITGGTKDQTLPETKETKEIAKTLPFGEVQPAPTRREIFRREVKSKGILTGTLSFAGAQVESLINKGQSIAVKKHGGKFDPGVSKLGGGVVKTSPYFIPGVGTPLIIGSGVEGLTSPEGRETIKGRKESLKESGLGPVSSTALAVTPEVAQIGLGGIGKLSQLRRASEISKIKKAETSFVAVVNEDKVAVATFTKLPNKEIQTLQTGKVKGNIIFAEGTQKVISKRGKEVTKELRSVTLSKDFGTARRFKDFGSFKLGGKGSPGVGGRTVSQTKGGEVVKDSFVGKVDKLPKTLLGREASIVVGGKPKTLKIFGKEGRVSVTTKGEVKGIVLKAKEQDIGFIPGSITGTTSAQSVKLQGTLGAQASKISSDVKASEVAIVKAVPTVKSIKAPITQLETPQVKTSQIEDVSPSLTMRISKQTTQEAPQILVKPDVQPSTQTKTNRVIVTRAITTPQSRSRSRTIPISKTVQEIAPATRQLRTPIVITKPNLKQKQQQRFRGTIVPLPARPIGIPRTPLKIIIPKIVIPRSSPITKQTGLFGVQVRRFGTFRTIGTSKTIRGAFNLGTERVSSTLGATFRITGKGRLPKAPKGFRRKGDLFIEKKELRLKKKSEVEEIQFFKRRSKK